MSRRVEERHPRTLVNILTGTAGKIKSIRYEPTPLADAQMYVKRARETLRKKRGKAMSVGTFCIVKNKNGSFSVIHTDYDGSKKTLATFGGK